MEILITAMIIVLAAALGLLFSALLENLTKR